MQPTLLSLPCHVVPFPRGSLTLQGFHSAQGAPNYLGHPVLWCQLCCPWTSGCLAVLPEWGSQQQDMDCPAVCRALAHSQPGWSSPGDPGSCLALDAHLQSTVLKCMPGVSPFPPGKGHLHPLHPFVLVMDSVTVPVCFTVTPHTRLRIWFP